MGVPASEVGYTPVMPRREDHEVNKRTCGGTGIKINDLFIIMKARIICCIDVRTNRNEIYPLEFIYRSN